MANPASVYCEGIGGRSMNHRSPDGSETGYCHLTNGEVVNEWDLFRAQSKGK
ncbi:DUF333 domain-containing protein [Paracoccus kondratievae]